MKILELTLPSTNVDAQEHLFQEVLGFPCTRLEGQQIQVHCGDTLLNFKNSNEQYYFHYCFLIPPGSLEAAIAFLDDRSFEPLWFKGSRVIQFSNGRSVYFLDADGNLAEFIERPTLGHPTQTTFQIEDVIRLNEIGMPAEDPIPTANELINRFGIERVSDGLFRDDFVWCGDYEGVFLVPVVGRNWMPTDKPAVINELEVRFETRTGEHEFSIRI